MVARLLLTALIAMPMAGSAAAHEIPADVTVRLIVLPEGDRLTILARVPLEAMRDFDWPRGGPGYLDIEEAQPLLLDAARLWLVPALSFAEDGRPLPQPTVRAVRIAAPADRSFADPEHARARFRSAVDPPVGLVPEQALLDVWLEVPIDSDRARFAITPQLARLGLRTTTIVRLVTPDGVDRIYQWVGDPGTVALDPRFHQAALRFVGLGFTHILDGVDHLLFLLCLVLPYRRLRPLVPIVTSFTVAHSITLIASAVGLAPRALWFAPLIETLIALSIVCLAIENVVGVRSERRWLVAFGFGLVHGFGFSFLLRESLQFAGGHLLTSLLAFNVGVELGQLAVLAAALPALALLRSRAGAARPLVPVIVSILVAHTAWHWMTERLADLRQYRFGWPPIDATLLAALLRWAALGLAIGGVAWALARLFARWNRRSVAPRDSVAAAPPER